MEIRDDGSGCFVRLTPIGYQYKNPSGDPYDDNWLIIKGRVQDRHQAWTFQDPALLVDEAHSIARWLRAAAAGHGTQMEVGADGLPLPSLQMIEPNIGLGLVEFTPTAVTVRFFLSLESAPPSSVESVEVDMEYSLDLTTAPGNLERAAKEWEDQLAQFPYRG
ncbi:hypothetical protein ACFPJ4_12790 [Lysinimonas soli]|uniref:Phage tail protein n=1 Tax=Lysinimonas soli TaxID=1074233 RepID=A0ABW0NU93_9MICO